MILNINDISHFLKIFKKPDAQNGIRKNILYTFIKIPLGLLVYPFDYDEMFEFGLNLGLFKENNGVVTLNDHGLNLNNMKHFGLDLTDEQIAYIVNNCLLGNKKFMNVTNFLRGFMFHEQIRSFIISDEQTSKYQNELELLSQLGVVRKQNRFWVVNPEYLDHVEQIKKRIHKLITQKQLGKILAEQKRVGERAEKLTVNYEINRLKKHNLIFESNHVKKISSTYVNKGYDIESFSCRNDTPNFFIEVKGRKYNLRSFIISINEIKTAEALGDHYAIYFWNNLGSTVLPEKPLKIIRNPFKKLSFDKCANCLSFLIEIK